MPMQLSQPEYLAGIEAVSSFLYILIVASTIFPIKYSKITHAIIVCLSLIAFFCIYRPVEVHIQSYTLYVFTLLICSFVFAVLTLQAKILNLLNLLVTCIFAIVVLKTIILMVFTSLIHVSVWSPQFEVQWHFVYYFLLALCGFFFVRFSTKTELPRRYHGAFLLCTFTAVVFVTLSKSNYIARPLIVLEFWTILLIYYLTYLLSNEFNRGIQEKIINSHLVAQLDQFNRTSSAMEQFRTERHEMKNTYFYISSLVKQHDYAALEAFVDSQLDYKATELEEIRTGNPELDLVLSQKISEARKSNIRVVSNIVIPENLPFAENDLSALILNLFDNAIDASRLEPSTDTSREIILALNQSKNFLRIELRNRVSYNVLKKNPKLQTSKKDSSRHGIGLKVVQSIVKKYDGFIQFSSHDGFFTVKVLLQFPQ